MCHFKHELNKLNAGKKEHPLRGYIVQIVDVKIPVTNKVRRRQQVHINSIRFKWKEAGGGGEAKE